MRALDKANTSIPCVIEGVPRPDDIAEMWRQHYSALFNSVESDPYKVKSSVSDREAAITFSEVYRALLTLQSSF